jgi:hypothetical protein
VSTAPLIAVDSGEDARRSTLDARRSTLDARRSLCALLKVFSAHPHFPDTRDRGTLGRRCEIEKSTPFNAAGFGYLRYINNHFRSPGPGGPP